MTTPRTAPAPADATRGAARPSGTAPPPARLTVLQSFPAPRSTTNPYLVELVGALPDDVRTLTFSWRTALTARYDVLHLHWPEKLLRGRTPLRTAVRYAATLALLARLTLRRTAVVRTLHNARPHEPGGPLEGLVLRALGRRTTLAIRLVAATPLPPGAHPDTPAVTIPHAHYRGWYAHHVLPPRHPGRILFFGLVRPYKGLEDLLSAFRDLPGDDVSLRVVGSPESPALARTVTALADGDERIGLHLEYVDDATLAAEVGAAQLVVLPYRRLHSSGAALLALSLDRPVLVPAGPTATDLADEVGARWVHTFAAPVTPDDLAAALAATTVPRPGPPPPAGADPGVSPDDPTGTAEQRSATPAAGGAERPDLSARDWDTLAAAHVRAYTTAATRARGRA